MEYYREINFPPTATATTQYDPGVKTKLHTNEKKNENGVLEENKKEKLDEFPMWVFVLYFTDNVPLKACAWKSH